MQAVRRGRIGVRITNSDTIPLSVDRIIWVTGVLTLIHPIANQRMVTVLLTRTRTRKKKKKKPAKDFDLARE